VELLASLPGIDEQGAANIKGRAVELRIEKEAEAARVAAAAAEADQEASLEEVTA
jgi:hypothetical protein